MKKILLAILPLLILSACGGNIKKEAKYPSGLDRTTTEDNIYAKPKSLFGDGGAGLFSKDRDEKESGSGGIGVNSFLWRASLDTISFMPLASADPFGGVILTDWYSPPETPNERLKMNVLILSRQLNSDGVRVKVFRQLRKSGQWIDATVAVGTGRKIEDSILVRARQMRMK